MEGRGTWVSRMGGKALLNHKKLVEYVKAAMLLFVPAWRRTVGA